MGTQLTHAPVYFVLAKVRFNLVAKLDTFVPEIQDQLRLKGYPDQRKRVVSTYHVNTAAPQQTMTTEEQVLYTAWNMEQTAGFILDNNSLSFQTTDYSVYGDFSAAFATGLKIVHERITLDFRERIGIRYLDAIYPVEDRTLDQYVQSSVLGMHGKLNGTMQHNFSETVHRNNAGLLISRAITEVGKVAFPPDLQPNELKLADRFKEKDGIHTILDTDAIRDDRQKFNVEDIVEQLALLKAEVSSSFKKTVTKDALKWWE